MPDATANFAELISDPSKWVINRAVPIFEPHEVDFDEVRDAAGKVVRPKRKVKVTEADLGLIAGEMRADEVAGQYGMITAGHLDPAGKETEQANAFGFHVNPRIMPTGPDQKPRLVIDEYLYPDKAEERGKYPYRSADYFPSAKTIFGVAVLKRKPRLKLGTFAYEDADRGHCYQYALEMPTPDGKPPEGGLEAENLEPECTEEESKLFDKAWKYFQDTYGVAVKGKPAANAEGTDNMADANKKPAEGNPAPKADDKAAYQYQEELAAYKAEVAQYKADLEVLRNADAARKAELDGIRLERDQERCAALMYQLEVEQYQLTADEKGKELKKLLAIPAAERPERLTELRSIYASRKVPTGRMETYSGPLEGGNVASDPHKAPSYHDAAMQYMYAHPGTQYIDAVEKVKAAASKG